MGMASFVLVCCLAPEPIPWFLPTAIAVEFASPLHDLLQWHCQSVERWQAVSLLQSVRPTVKGSPRQSDAQWGTLLVQQPSFLSSAAARPFVSFGRCLGGR